MHQAAAQESLVGQKIGNYVVRSKLGEGGMGAVYLAEHPLIGKQVALKILHKEFSHNEEIAERFLNEAKAVNNIGHPNIVDILDFGVVPEGYAKTVYFIMEYLGGRSLAHILRSEAPLSPERALSISLQIADALSASHKQDIVHRDLKPDNVMLIQRGQQMDFVKVLDFGIAKLSGEQSGSRKTRTGIVMGTPAYMSPEQCEGKGNIDHRTDVYALGILLFQMLTGQVPFKGEGFGEILVQHLTQLPVRPSQLSPMIPPHVEVVVLKALEKQPYARYPDMDVFMQALADPVGFVERHGGISGFLTTDLSQVQGGTPVALHTPLPGQLTPLPGQLSGSVASPVSGVYANSRPPDNHSQMQTTGTSKAMVLLLSMLAAVALGLGVFLFLSKNKSDDNSEATASATHIPNADKPEGDPIKAPVKDPTINPVTNPASDPATDPTVATVEDPVTNPASDPEPPPEPQTITLKLMTTPKGASVYIGDEKKSRGKTPLELTLDKGADEISIKLKRRRYQTIVKKFIPETSSEFELNLVKVKRKSTKKRDKHVDGDTTLEDPDW